MARETAGQMPVMPATTATTATSATPAMPASAAHATSATTATTATSATSASAAPFVEIRDVTFVYPETTRAVLDGASLEARAGEVTCLMGVNGCGKSTLIDCVLGANRVQSGSIRIGGDDAATLRPV